MVGILGFLVLAVGGGGLALYLGVPPLWIGAYVLGLLGLGVVFGFGSSSGSGGSNRSSSGSRSSSSSSGGSIMDAANGFLDNIGDSSTKSSKRAGKSRRSQNKYPSTLQDRVVGDSEPSENPEDIVEEIEEGIEETDKEDTEEEEDVETEVDIVEDIEEDLEEDEKLDRDIEKRLERLKRDFEKMKQIVSESRKDKISIDRIKTLSQDMKRTEEEIYAEVQKLKEELRRKHQIMKDEQKDENDLEKLQDKRRKEIERLQEHIEWIEEMQRYLEKNVDLRGN